MVVALPEGVLRERWPLWKAGLHNLKMILPWECNFQMGGLAYDIALIKRHIYIRSVNETFNNEGSIKQVVESNLYYKEYQEEMEINIVGGKKWNIILGMLWLAYYNSEFNWKIREVRIRRCL